MPIQRTDDGMEVEKERERYTQEMLDYAEICYSDDHDEISPGMGTLDLATKKKAPSIPKTGDGGRHNREMVYSDILVDSDRDNSDSSSHQDDNTEVKCFICNEGGGKRCIFL
jgi:hypothetical protein